MIDGERLATPSGVAAVLETYGLAARKSLGQNFLIDRNVLARIVATARLHPDDVVLEIGPGLGVLTRELSRECLSVIAVEVDSGFVRWLTDMLAGDTSAANVQLVHEDALEVDLAGLLAARPPGPAGTYKVVANLPYYITSPLLMRFLEEGHPFSSIVVLVQREVARRLDAAPGTKDYGALSVAVQLRADVEMIAVVSPGAFYPSPTVDSAVVRLTMRDFPEPVAHGALLRAVVRAAFGQRRKTVRNALRHAAPDWTDIAGVHANEMSGLIDSALALANVDGTRRGETLTPVEFIRVANAFVRINMGSGTPPD